MLKKSCAAALAFCVMLTCILCACSDKKTADNNSSAETSSASGAAIKINTNALPEVYYSVSGSSAFNLCNNIISAFNSFKTSVKFNDEEDPVTAVELLKEGFPLFFADTDPAGIDVDFTDMTLKWTYTVASEDEHKKVIENFVTTTETLLSCVRMGATDGERAAAIYKEFTETVKLSDNSSSASSKGGYGVITNRGGDSAEIAKALSYLFNCAKIKAVTVENFNLDFEDAQENYNWVLADISGKSYYFDSSADCRDKTFSGFGLTTEELENKGYSSADFILPSAPEILLDDIFDISDKKFEKLHSGAKNPVIDFTNHLLRYTNNTAKEETVSLD